MIDRAGAADIDKAGPLLHQLNTPAIEQRRRLFGQGYRQHDKVGLRQRRIEFGRAKHLIDMGV